MQLLLPTVITNTGGVPQLLTTLADTLRSKVIASFSGGKHILF